MINNNNEICDNFLVLHTEEALISCSTFCRVFPFHLLFNRQMRIVQTGRSVSRVIPRWVVIKQPKIGGIIDRLLG